MTNFKAATTFLLLLSNLVSAQDENCVPIEELGTPSLNDFAYSIAMDVDEKCDYTLTFSFRHDEDLPFPTDPVTECDPLNAPPALASDGLPYFAFRWFYQEVPDAIKQATGIDHISLDWNACGHPPFDIFTAPHYDIHFYRVSPDDRTCMTCNTIEGTPVCDTEPGAQTTPNGEAFFDVAMAGEETPAVVQRAFDPNGQPSNMPPGFIVGEQDFVILMGAHAWNPNQQPPNALQWMDPIWVMGSYAYEIPFYETMIPFSFMSGEQDDSWTEFLTYEDQTIDHLPSSYVVNYDAATKTVTMTLTGPATSGFCNESVEPENLPEIEVGVPENLPEVGVSENLPEVGEPENLPEVGEPENLPEVGEPEVTKEVEPAVVDEPEVINELPFIGDLIERAYPTWCIDENEKRLYDVETCEDGTPNGRFSPLYFTKQYSGGDPDLGGYPTNIDINYAFEFAAPFLGQACAGSPHMCREDFDGSSINCKKCPKLTTDNDNGPYGPGHIPPHISLAAVSRAYKEGKGGDISEWFDFESNACRILPSKLLSLIRLYYPREEDGSVYYPPPFTDLGGAYPLEFVNLAGETCEKEGIKHSTAGNLECYEDHSGDVSQFPDYLEVGHGSPHYCTKDGIAADINPDYCPYIFFGPNRGKYRHPHIAFSAVEVYLSNLIMPDKCGTTWDDSNYPAPVDTTVAFPQMSDCNVEDELLSHPQQPTIDNDGMWIWPGPEGYMKKPVVGNFAVHLVTVYNTENPPYQTVNDETLELDDEVEDSGSVSALVSFSLSVAIVMVSLLV